jgi:lysophospholipase L1-like esterase
MILQTAAKRSSRAWAAKPIIGLCCLLSAMASFGSAHGAPRAMGWISAFGASPAAFEPLSDEMVRSIAARSGAEPSVIAQMFEVQSLAGTFRYRVATSAGGQQLRLRLSNEESPTSVKLLSVTITRADEGYRAVPGTLQNVTFGRAAKFEIPAGAPALSDPIAFPVKAGDELLVSVVTANEVKLNPLGTAGFLYSPGNHAAEETLPGARPVVGRPMIAGVEVYGPARPGAIVAFGDSITDGSRGKVGDLRGWPEQLARRMANRDAPQRYAVVNSGIVGNRLLAPGWGRAGLARLDRDVLQVSGVRWLVLLEGTNDIGMSGAGVFGDNPDVTADDLIAGYRQVIARCHARGVKVILGTITPTGGSITHSSAQKDQVRRSVNDWIRHSGEPDGVIDFDLMLRDPANPNRLDPAFDSGDHLHPNSAGYLKMGNSIDLSLFG